MMTAATTPTTPTPKQIRRQQRQSSPTYSDFVVFNNNKDAMMNTPNTVIDTTPLEDTDEWTSFNHPTDWKVTSSTKSIATVKTADDDDEWTLFDDQSTAFNTAMGNDIVDKTTIIMSTTKSSSSSVNDGSTTGGSTTCNSTTQRSVTTPSYTEKEYDIDTLVRIKQAAAAQQKAAQQQKQSKHTRSTSSSSLAAASAAASVGCGSKASIQSILRKSSYTADANSSKSKASGSVTFDSVKSKTSTFMEELQTTCGQYFCSRSRGSSGTVGINDILTGKCQDLLLTKDERKVDVDYTFLGKVISCATLNIPFDECGGCGSSGMMEDDEDTAVSTLTEIRWSDDVVKK